MRGQLQGLGAALDLSGIWGGGRSLGLEKGDEGRIKIDTLKARRMGSRSQRP